MVRKSVLFSSSPSYRDTIISVKGLLAKYYSPDTLNSIKNDRRHRNTKKKSKKKREKNYLHPQ